MFIKTRTDFIDFPCTVVEEESEIDSEPFVGIIRKDYVR